MLYITQLLYSANSSKWTHTHIQVQHHNGITHISLQICHNKLWHLCYRGLLSSHLSIMGRHGRGLYVSGVCPAPWNTSPTISNYHNSRTLLHSSLTFTVAYVSSYSLWEYVVEYLISKREKNPSVRLQTMNKVTQTLNLAKTNPAIWPSTNQGLHLLLVCSFKDVIHSDQ